MHLIAAFAEWITMFCLNFFLLSYTREMHKISISTQVFITIDNLNLISNNLNNDNENSFFQNNDIEIHRNRNSEYNQNIIS